MTGLRTELRRSRLASGALALIIFLIYLPVLIVPYAFTDDYFYLALAKRLGVPSPPHAASVMHAAAAEGRPFWGLVVTPVFSLAGTIDNLRLVRILTVIGLIALALFLYWALVRVRIARLPSALLALLVCTVPSFQLYASWTVSFSMPWTAILAGCASLLVVSALDGPRRLMIDRLIAATVLLIVALLVYQPVAMFFWVFLAIALAGSVGDAGRAWRLARAHVGVAAAAFTLAYVAYRVSIALVGPDAPGADRGTLTHDPVGKAEWFAHWAVYQALNLFKLRYSPWVALLVAVVAAGGIVLWLMRTSRRPLLFVALGLLLIPLTVLPNLVVEETYERPVWRTQASLASLVALYFGFGALAIWVALRDWLDVRVARRVLALAEAVAAAIAVAFVATSAVLAERHVSTLLVEPQRTELRLLRQQVAALSDPVRRVAFVLTGPADRVPGSPLSDEFGMPSTTPWYPANALVLLLLREQGRLQAPRPVVDVLPSTTPTVPGGSAVNLNGLLGQR